jgi:DNA repair protein RadA/Sms
VIGWDTGRLAMVLAVLETRCGLVFANHDVYLNVAGGLRIAEPAADLAVAAALVSALGGRPVPPDAVVFGEIGLAGEVRAVSQGDARLKEAAKLGFARAFVPARRRQTRGSGEAAIRIDAIEDLGTLVARLSGPGRPQSLGRTEAAS